MTPAAACARRPAWLSWQQSARGEPANTLITSHVETSSQTL
jgi:hypothetical protein